LRSHDAVEQDAEPLRLTVAWLPRTGPPTIAFQATFTGGFAELGTNSIVVTEPVYEADDADCCPSKERWVSFTRVGDSYRLVSSETKPRGR
jgi:hypothetical protein